MAAIRLKKFLDENHVPYETINHPIAFSALHLCEVCHIKSADMAKVVMCKSTNGLFMVVLPAHHHVNFEKLSFEIGQKACLATEEEFAPHFPDCEVGAMPPFGNLYDLDVFVEECLTHDEAIAFNAGNHSECFKVSWHDFESLVRPKILNKNH